MKKILLLSICFLSACAGTSTGAHGPKYRITTEREKPYYLSTAPEKVEDTCPGHDIIKQYTCTAEEADQAECFDVYMVQGSPMPDQRYTLLQENIQVQPVTAQPECPAEVNDCSSFLKALQDNLEFSWYLVNFPSSSFEECKETYDCKRIDCYQSNTAANGEVQSTLVSCVYKKNQIFFVGSSLTCHKTLR